jgi:hypothetical protein
VFYITITILRYISEHPVQMFVRIPKTSLSGTEIEPDLADMVSEQSQFKQ